MAVKHPVFARLYDFYMLPHELWGVGRRRRRVARDAIGLVLDLGAGTGLNLPHYRKARMVVAVEPDPGMLRQAGRRAMTAKIPVHLVLARGEALPFSDGAFNTVAATLVFASISDAAAAAREVVRVLKADGIFRFFEHFRSASPLFAGLQDLVTPFWRRLVGGCEPNRDVLRIFAEAGFEVLETTKLRGTFLLNGIARPIAASQEEFQKTSP